MPRKPASPKPPAPAPTGAAAAATPKARAAPAKPSATPRARKPPAGDGQPAPPPVPRAPRAKAPPPAAAPTAAAATFPAKTPARAEPPPGVDPSFPAWAPAPTVADRGSRLLGWALGASILLHALLLALRFSPIDLKELLDRGPPLEVALVNAKSPTKPTKADILAQAHLDGGGNTDENRRAKTPLPALPKDSANNEITVATQKVEQLQEQTQELLTQLRGTPMAPAAPKPTDALEKPELPTSTELMQRTLEAMRLEAQIAKDMEAYQKRPKRRFVGARAEEYRFARYVEDWRLKIERVGNLNYPEAARQLRLYGSLLITVSIRSDGSVENVEINRSSGQRVLDAAARKIVEMAAPYAPFPPDIRRDTDILHITRTWTFTRTDELHSE